METLTVLFGLDIKRKIQVLRKLDGVKMKSTYSIQNRSSWPDGASGEAQLFESNLTQQSQERQGGVAAILTHLGAGDSDVRCLVDYSALNAGDEVQGHYLVETTGLEHFPEKMVLQVKTQLCEDTYSLSNEVFEYLNENGVQAASLVPMKDGALVGSHESYAFALTSYTPGHHLRASSYDDMTALGRGVAKLEQAMNALPEDLQNRITENIVARESLIQSGIGFALDAKNEARIKEILPSLDIAKLRNSMETFRESGKAFCHGDLIDKNAIISDDDGELVVLDFDDMNYLSEGLDLGMLAFRAGLVGGSIGGEGGAQAMKNIIYGYNSVATADETVDREYLFECMEMAMTYKVALTLGMDAENLESEISSMDRFKAHGGNYQRGMDKLEAINQLELNNLNLGFSGSDLSI